MKFSTMSYAFKLKIEKEKSKLALFCGNKKIAVYGWRESRDTGRCLLEAIAVMLQKNNLNPEQIANFSIDSEMPEYYTSARIAETVRKIYIFGVKSLA